MGNKPELKYFFSMKIPLNSVPVGGIPAGFRVDLNYEQSADAVSTESASFDEAWRPSGPVTLEQSDDRTIKSLQAALAPPEQSGQSVRGNATADSAKAGAQAARGPSNVPPTGEPPLYGSVQVARLAAKKGNNIEKTLKLLSKDRKLEWFGINGNVLSGGNWVTVRSDGVAVFDGRLTFKADDDFVFDAVVSGAVELRDRDSDSLPTDQKNGASTVYNDWIEGRLKKDKIPVVLSVRFEAAESSEPWATSSLNAASREFWKYQRLVRGQFIAIGAIQISKGIRYSPPTHFSAEVFEIIVSDELGVAIAKAAGR